MRPLGLVSSALLALTLAPAGPDRSGSPPATAGLLATVGDVGAGQAVLWARGGGAEPIRLRVTAGAGEPVLEAERAPDARRDFTVHVRVDRLRPGAEHHYEIAQGAERVRGRFTAAPAPDADVPVRVLWSADLGGRGHCRRSRDGYPIFGAMAERRAHFFIFAGDTVYADQPCGRGPFVPGGDFVATTLEDFHAKHRYNRADPAVQSFMRATPVVATWDDHEVRNNFAGSEEPLTAVGRQAFVDYWPLAAAEADAGRLYRALRWGRHLEVFVLDTRQYRSPNGHPDGPDKTMLGAEQRRWLVDGVGRSDATWKVVVSSVPLGLFTGGGAADAWSRANLLGFPRRRSTGFAWERDHVLDRLRARGVRNLVFVGGEVHHAELIRHEPWTGFVVHEFLAGPLSARAGYRRPLDRSLRSRSLGALGWTMNFGEFTADGDALRVRIYDAAGAPRVGLTLNAAGR